MRAKIALSVTAGISALAIMAMISTGRAQTDRLPSDVPPAPSDQAPVRNDGNHGPTPAQESAIPYRPCNTNVAFADGRHVCLNDR